jgi:multidrug resistance efflux pump
MLNISRHSIKAEVPTQEYTAFQRLEARSVSKFLLHIIYGLTVIAIIALFLPWTQNVRSAGYVTTLNPDDKPQTVQSIIDGKVEEWYVQEGDIVRKGDTIMKISEAKEEYLDPQLLERTQGQITAKSQSAKAYSGKAQNLTEQYQALLRNKEVKLEQNEIKIQQTRFKIRGDSMDLQAAQISMENAEKQWLRTKELYDQGIKSLTELENKRASFQDKQAKVSLLQNKLAGAQNEIENLQANRSAIISDFDDKIAKSRSDRMSALSDQYTAEASVNKLQSDFNKYQVRVDNYYVRSPIDGIVTQAIKDGLGELIKSGEALVSIIPTNLELAVEAYIEPFDVPLVKKGQEVRIQFDGWPAIVFSGWPNSSFGTFPGKVFAIDNFISDNGKYRILIAQDDDGATWPQEVRVGGGVNALMLLNDVPLYYELWRQLNGFPPDYYKNGQKDPKEPKLKAPIKKVK